MTSTSSERVLPVARQTGEKIHGIIWSRRMVQGTVAKAVGVSGSTFSKKLRGEEPITVDELMRIAGVLEVDPGELLPRLDSNQQPSGYASAQVRALPGEVIPITRGGSRSRKVKRRPKLSNTSPSAAVELVEQ